MMNSKTYNIKVTRLEVIDLMMACNLIAFSARKEMNDPATSAERKRILEGTEKKWKTLRGKLKAQLDERDKKEEIA